MDRRLAAILCADVVGFSRLMGADEAGTLARLKAFEAATIERLPSQKRMPCATHWHVHPTRRARMSMYVMPSKYRAVLPELAC